jgi:hypothetical protein
MVTIKYAVLDNYLHDDINEISKRKVFLTEPNEQAASMRGSW